MRKAPETNGAVPDGSDALVTFWGFDEPRCKFLYVDDLANDVRFVLETPEDEIRTVASEGILNVGVGEGLSINDLMALIQGGVGYEGPVEDDRSKPDGTPRKLVDTSQMDELVLQLQLAAIEQVTFGVPPVMMLLGLTLMVASPQGPTDHSGCNWSLFPSCGFNLCPWE